MKLMMTYLTRAGGLTRGKERGYFLPMPHLLSAAPNSWHFCMLLETRTKMLLEPRNTHGRSCESHWVEKVKPKLRR